VPYDLLIFDFDGVLVDSEVLWSDALAVVLTDLGYPVTVEDCRRRFTGATGGAVRKMVEADRGQPLPPDFEMTVRDEAYALLAVDLKVVDGADAMLRSIAGPRCVASNSDLAWVDRGLRGSGLDRYFPLPNRFSAEQVVHGKPAPDVFILAAATMGVAPADCIVIEDSVHGVAGARAAGMRVLGFTGASHILDGHDTLLRQAGVEVVFDDLTTLPAMLQSL
jgi:HAD superfamily hydrolase (TIGR01509 family)